ncbi:MAG: hypothetical protein WCV80_03825 [Candidatus Paceibacterota bacterium]|jgi:hypothetical protein
MKQVSFFIFAVAFITQVLVTSCTAQQASVQDVVVATKIADSIKTTQIRFMKGSVTKEDNAKVLTWGRNVIDSLVVVLMETNTAIMKSPNSKSMEKKRSMEKVLSIVTDAYNSSAMTYNQYSQKVFPLYYTSYTK